MSSLLNTPPEFRLHLLDPKNPCPPLRNPSLVQQYPPWPQRTPPPPYPLPHTNEQTHVLRTSGQICDQVWPKPRQSLWCWRACTQPFASWPYLHQELRLEVDN